MKEYIVTFQRRYYPLEGTHKKHLCAPNKQYIRNNWHCYISTDEYRIVKIEEVKS